MNKTTNVLLILLIIATGVWMSQLSARFGNDGFITEVITTNPIPEVEVELIVPVIKDGTTITLPVVYVDPNKKVFESCDLLAKEFNLIYDGWSQRRFGETSHMFLTTAHRRDGIGGTFFLRCNRVVQTGDISLDVSGMPLRPAPSE